MVKKITFNLATYLTLPHSAHNLFSYTLNKAKKGKIINLCFVIDLDFELISSLDPDPRINMAFLKVFDVLGFVTRLSK